MSEVVKFLHVDGSESHRETRLQAQRVIVPGPIPAVPFTLDVSGPSIPERTYERWDFGYAGVMAWAYVEEGAAAALVEERMLAAVAVGWFAHGVGR